MVATTGPAPRLGFIEITDATARVGYRYVLVGKNKTKEKEKFMIYPMVRYEHHKAKRDRQARLALRWKDKRIALIKRLMAIREKCKNTPIIYTHIICAIVEE